MTCHFLIQTAFDTTALQVVFYILFGLTLGLFVFGLVNIVAVVYRRHKFANILLLMFYIFAELCLLLRVLYYIYAMVLTSVDDGTDTCNHIVMPITFQDLPDYLYLISGLCQLFIVIQITVSWELEQQSQSQRSESSFEQLYRTLQNIKKLKNRMLVIFAFVLSLSIVLFIIDLTRQVQMKQGSRLDMF
jgi:hypothetical protein